jgi:hypothetical protein
VQEEEEEEEEKRNLRSLKRRGGELSIPAITGKTWDGEGLSYCLGTFAFVC